MKKIIFLYCLLFYSLILLGQDSYLDTIQSKKFHIEFIKISDGKYELNFTNISKKTIYIVPSIMDPSPLNGKQSVFLGQYENPLSDAKYFELIKIKRGEKFISELSSRAVKFEIIVSVILNGKIVKMENKYYFKNPEYFNKKKTFIYYTNCSKSSISGESIR